MPTGGDGSNPSPHQPFANMNQDILKIARKKFNKLAPKYDKFINVFVDDWRGFCFVFDTLDTRICNNNCQNCDLYKLLKEESLSNNFFAGLKKANCEDKRVFGLNNFLNCKSYEQYLNCFINFIVQNNLTGQDLIDEIKLVLDIEIIYTKDGDPTQKTKKFKKEFFKKIIPQLFPSQLATLHNFLKINRMDLF